MAFILQLASIVVAVLLIALIMLQVKGGALGNLMGSGSSDGFSHTRRGLEKTMFQITIFLSITFMAISLFSVVFA